MPYALVQTAHNTGGSCAYPASVTAGNLLVASVSATNTETDAVTSVTDSLGQTWTRIGVGPSNAITERPYLYYKFNTLGGPCTVTASASAGNPPMVNVMEFSGAPTTDPLDISGANSGPTGGSHSVVLAGCAANDLLVGYIAQQNTPSPGTGFTTAQASSSWNAENAEYELDSGAAGSQTVLWTGSGKWSAVAASFKVAGASTTPVSQSQATCYEAASALAPTQLASYEAMQACAVAGADAYEATGALAATGADAYEAAAAVAVATGSGYEATQGLSAAGAAAYEAKGAIAGSGLDAYEALAALATSSLEAYESLASVAPSQLVAYEAQGVSASPVSQSQLVAYEALAALARAQLTADEWLAPAARGQLAGYEAVQALVVQALVAYAVTALVSMAQSSAVEWLQAALATALVAYEHDGPAAEQGWITATLVMFAAVAAAPEVTPAVTASPAVLTAVTATVGIDVT